MVLASCSKDFVNLSPETQVNTNNFFKTPDQYWQAVTGVYQALRGNVSPSGWLMGEMRSDNTHYEYNVSNRGVAIVQREYIANFLDDASDDQTKAKYVSDYVGISRANTILDRAEASSLSAGAKDSIIGETEVLRAFFYFDLVQYYGKVPLNLHEIANPSQAFALRSSVDSVYTAIVADLTDAIKRLPPPTFPQNGHVSLGTAKTMLANVYMVQKKYADASALLTDVTHMGYSLQTNYADAFDPAHKNNAESIFEVQYKQGPDGQQSDFIYNFVPITTNTSVITGTPGNAINSGGWNVPTQDLLNAYEPDDKRLDASIAVAEGHVDATGYTVVEAVKSIVGYTTPPGKISKLFIRKYLHPHALPNNTDDDWPVYRYADALLLLAESLNEQHKPADALPYLNQVRQRAGLTASTETDEAALRDIIAHERRIELAFESHRWTDLLRTGKAISVMTDFGDAIKAIDHSVPANGYQVNEDRLLFPIPLTEIQRNPALTQNHGY